MIAKCPACKTIGEHTYNGIQEGLPVRDSDNKLVKDSNGNYVTKSGELWTCKNCGSTWFQEIG
jgi:transposase-like protein